LVGKWTSDDSGVPRNLCVCIDYHCISKAVIVAFSLLLPLYLHAVYPFLYFWNCY